MVKVAYVVPYLSGFSGWRTFSVGAVSSLARHVEPTIVASQEDAEAARSLFPDYPAMILPEVQGASLNSAAGTIKVLSSLARIWTRKDPPRVDLVHSLEAYPAGLMGAALAARLKRPHLISPCGTYGVVWARSRLDAPACARVLSKAAGIFPISRGTGEMMKKHFGRAMAGVPVAPVLIGNHYFSEVPAEQALERVLPADPLIISVGAVKPRKGHDVGIRAFARVKQKFPTARYVIIGSTADLVYLEAGAHGLPVVGTRTGGVPDAVQHGRTGLLAEPEDVEGIASALIRALSDPELARRLGRENRKWAETLTWERYADEQFGHYRKYL